MKQIYIYIILNEVHKSFTGTTCKIGKQHEENLHAKQSKKKNRIINQRKQKNCCHNMSYVQE